VEKPLEFKARKEIVNGKITLVIDPISEIIKHADGIGQSVVMHMPSLNLINKTRALHGID